MSSQNELDKTALSSLSNIFHNPKYNSKPRNTLLLQEIQITNTSHFYPHYTENHQKIITNSHATVIFTHKKHQKSKISLGNPKSIPKSHHPIKANEKITMAPKTGYRSPTTTSHKHARINTTNHTSIKSKKK